MLAQRILDCLRSHGPIPRGELAHWFRDTDHIDFDSTLTRLMRQNSVSLELGKYEAVEPKLSWHAPFVSQAGSEPVSQLGGNRDAAPPTAAEEVAASLKPATSVCIDCGPQPVHEFRRSSAGKLHKRCYKCAGLTISNAMKQHHKVNGGSGERADGSLTGSGAKLPDGAKPSPTPAASNTPSGHPPVVNPQTANPAGMPVESMEQVGSAPTTARALTSLPTSPISPVAGSSATGHVADSVLDRLAGKRVVLVLRRERLRCEFEASLAAVEFGIQEIDLVTERVMKILEGA